MDIKKTIKENSQLLISVGTVIGMAIGIINFFILASIAPIERRVEALENYKGEIRLDIKEIPVISSKLDTLREDIKDIKSVLGVR